MNNHVASREVAKLLTFFVVEAIKRDGHSCINRYQDHEGVCVLCFRGSAFSLRPDFIALLKVLWRCYKLDR